MIATAVRSITDKEYKILQDRILKIPQLFNFEKIQGYLLLLFLIAVFVVIGFIAGDFTGKAYNRFPDEEISSFWQGVGGLLGPIIGITFINWLFNLSKNQRREILYKDLTKGTVDIILVQTLKVIQCQPPKGSNQNYVYFVDGGNGKVLFLNGDYLETAIATKEFPNTRFELTRGRFSGETFALISSGEPLRLTPYDFPHIFAYGGYIPGDGEILDCSIETLEEKLRDLRFNRS